MNRYQTIAKYFVIWSLVLMSISNRLFCCLPVFLQLCFSRFPLFYHTQHCSLICRMLLHIFVTILSVFILFLCMVLVIMIDQTLIQDVFLCNIQHVFSMYFCVFLIQDVILIQHVLSSILILALNKVKVFLTKHVLSLSKKLATNFLTLPIEIL